HVTGVQTCALPIYLAVDGLDALTRLERRRVEPLDGETRVLLAAPVVGALTHQKELGVAMQRPPVARVTGRTLGAQNHFQRAVGGEREIVCVEVIEVAPRRGGPAHA